MSPFEEATYFLTLGELGQMSSDEIRSHLRNLKEPMAEEVAKAKQEEKPSPPPASY